MPSLRVKPVEGCPETVVTVIGTGFRPNISYRIQFQAQWLRPGTTNNRGALVTQIKIPPVPNGVHHVTVQSQAAHQLAHTTFTVRPHIVKVEPAEITLGGPITLHGAGFGSKEPIQVRLDEHRVALDPKARTNSDGTFTVVFTVTEEMIPPAPVRITVTGEATGVEAQAQQKTEVKLAS